MAPMPKTRRPKSADSSTKPLRSSPLAGPALALPALCHLHPKSLDANEQQQPFCDSCSVALRRRNYTLITTSTRSLSNSDGTTAAAARPRPAVPEWDTDPFQSIPPRSRLRPQSSSGVSPFRRPIPIVEEEDEIEGSSTSKDTSNDTSYASTNSSTSEFTTTASTASTTRSPPSLTRDNSWYTANPYDVTPRFSRLGLSGSTVVMPLSPKEHRKLSRNNSSASTKSNSTSPTIKIVPPPPIIIDTPKYPTPPTRISLQPPSPTLPSSSSSSSPQLQETLSRTTSISSIASASQLEMHMPISRRTSAPSLTRSRNSGDSLSTSYESLSPTTPPLEVTETVDDNGDDDGEIRAEIHYSVKDNDTTTTRPDRELTASNLIGRLVHPDHLPPQSPSLPTTTTTTTTLSAQTPFIQTPTFPKDIKKGRDCLRTTKLVRIKLQPVDFDDFENSFSTLKTTTTTTTTNTTRTTTTSASTMVMTAAASPMTASMTATTEMEKGLIVDFPQVPVPIPTLIQGPTTTTTTTTSTATVMAAVGMVSEEDNNNQQVLPTIKKKRSIFKTIFKNILGKW